MKRFAAALLGAFLLTAAPAGGADVGVINLTVAHSWSGIAPCLSPGHQSAEAITGKLRAAVRDARIIDAEVIGVRFQNQPEPLVAAFRQMTGQLSRRTVLIPRDCRTVECAVSALFGPEDGPRLLLLAAVYRYNASAFGGAATQPWSTEELDGVIAAFEDLPPSIFPLGQTEYRILAHRHDVPAAAAAHAMFELAAQAGEGEPGIIIAAGWHKAAGAERRAIIIHEFAHEFVRARGKSIDWPRAWATAAGADAAIAGHVAKPTVASAYAQKNLDEDFAEAFTAYRYMAPLLLRRAPHRYAFLRDQVFGGVEYGSSNSCAPASAEARR